MSVKTTSSQQRPCNSLSLSLLKDPAILKMCTINTLQDLPASALSALTDALSKNTTRLQVAYLVFSSHPPRLKPCPLKLEQVNLGTCMFLGGTEAHL